MSTESKLKVSLFDVVDEISASAKLTKANEAFSWEASVFPVINRPYWQMFLGILEKRKTIPAWQQKDEFLQALLANQTLILVGETGRRKTNKIFLAMDHLTPLQLRKIYKEHEEKLPEGSNCQIILS